MIEKNKSEQAQHNGSSQNLYVTEISDMLVNSNMERHQQNKPQIINTAHMHL